ncbi:MAG: hypothetical protein R3A13_05200 [Bdellovibrionota bacterium]
MTQGKYLMFRTTKPYLILFSLSFVFCFQVLAFAEVLCSSEVKYRWKKIEEETPIDESWKIIEDRGAIKELAEADLKLALNYEKEKAKVACMRAHENLAGCISGRHSAMRNIIGQLSFTARRVIEEAIAEDCKISQGQCLEVVSSEPKCEEQKVETEDLKEAEGDKKDAKTDKKGKK